MKRFLIVITATLLFFQASAHAAPIGVPGATVGTNNSRVTAEINILSDRDLNVPPGTTTGTEIENRQLILKGEVGLNKRVDLNVRFGFGTFEVSPGINEINTDNGPLFGIGFKATWAELPDSNIKIGTVVQTLRIRGEQDGGTGVGPGDIDGTRHSYTEYDLAIGAYYAPSKDRAQKKKELMLLPYGGVVWSGVDIDGVAREDKTFGIFFGTVIKTGGKVQYGVELRIPDQTALSFSASYRF
ncbi:MAG: hypothetical protein ABGX83_04345 [Nitrospira sp.]|nr:hypothetical protein [Candidatus Manganitrophaceae bacterium]HIL35347.1 hypothetical protein [Candidatus Manganitrophaceae bacterium]